MNKSGDIFEEQPKLAVYRHYIQNILDERPHVLSMEQEALLAGASEIFGASSNTFSILNNADLEFPTVQNAEGRNDSTFSWRLWSINGKCRSICS